MKYLYVLFILPFIAGCVSHKSHSKGQNILQAADLKPYGRYVLQDKEKLELISSAVHFSISFEGKDCTLFAFLPDWQDHNYLQYELDGVYQKRIRLNRQDKSPVVISAPQKGTHTLTIYKATEAHTGAIFIQKLTGRNLKPVSPSKAPLIEFIGNSITCGAAADPSEVPCGTGSYHDQHNSYYAYGPRLARALGADYVLSSVSGIGIYRNWNSDGPVMPEVYESADFQKDGGRFWDFSRYQPKMVSIALGTNDFSEGDRVKPRLPFDSARFVNGYIQFVRLVKSKYSNAQIVLLSSAMLNGPKKQLLQNCLTAVKDSINLSAPADKPLDLFFFAPMQARGCSGHPNVEDHAILAEQLIPFFRKYL